MNTIAERVLISPGRTTPLPHAGFLLPDRGIESSSTAVSSLMATANPSIVATGIHARTWFNHDPSSRLYAVLVGGSSSLGELALADAVSEHLAITLGSTEPLRSLSAPIVSWACADDDAEPGPLVHWNMPFRSSGVDVTSSMFAQFLRFELAYLAVEPGVPERIEQLSPDVRAFVAAQPAGFGYEFDGILSKVMQSFPDCALTIGTHTDPEEGWTKITIDIDTESMEVDEAFSREAAMFEQIEQSKALRSAASQAILTLH